jgi:hypothetical protein
MEKEPRKATDVLLELESKIEVLLGIVKSQDLNIKILSNKLNTLMEKMDKQPAPVVAPQIMVEAVNTKSNIFNQAPPPDPGKQLAVSADFNLPLEEAPTGFRRTSRPETYSGDNAFLPKNKKPNAESSVKFPTQLPRGAVKAEVVVPPHTANKVFEQAVPEIHESQQMVQNAIPIVQRVVDANGKSAFLADVEITDLSSMASVFKTRTNGTGKWMASLPVGTYRVVIRKRESLTKEKLEAAQDIQVDGMQSTLELPLMIIKK